MKLNFLYIALAVALLWVLFARQKPPLKQNGAISMDDDVLLGAQGAMYPLDEPNFAGDTGEYAFAG